MKLIVNICFFVVFAFGAACAVAQPGSTQQSSSSSTALAGDPEVALRAFMYALYANDLADYRTRILPDPESAVLVGTQKFTEEQLNKLRMEIDGLRLRQTSMPSFEGKPTAPPYVVGTKAIYFAQFRGVNLTIPMEVTADGWKVDVRYWLAMRKQSGRRPQKTDPEIVAKAFLLYVLAKKPDALNEFVTKPVKGEEYTAANDLPPGDLDQILSLCAEMPMVRARPKERLLLPSGELIGGSEKHDTLVLVGLMGPVEIPFLLKKKDNAWKVVPQRYFEMLRNAGAI
ncbi:MAG: hypothetical protein ABR612_14745 [Chromatocurvus sp.]